VPIPDPVAEAERAKKRVILEGDVPSPANPPQGCNFCTRCPAASRVMKEQDIDCTIVEPKFSEIESGHWVACHLYEACRPS
jgi:oligopeptide transport system ATP-binding protein